LNRVIRSIAAGVPPLMPSPDRVLDFAGASVLVFADARSATEAAADRISQKLRIPFADLGVRLGLATGSTPIPVYEHLVAMHRAGEISFARAVTFNLDEYYPISPLDPQSYRSYMHRHLFAHVDIAPNCAHVLDGTVPLDFVDKHAADFDHWIDEGGGLDLQLLGIGRNGHIGFNEPSELPLAEALSLPTRLVELHPKTTADAARDFGGEANVPRRALTVGVAPILAARAILLLALGSAKAGVVAQSLTGPVTAKVPASLLQTAASKVTWLLDSAAASDLR
jgi:glucosamine-6-phosphate deaminase